MAEIIIDDLFIFIARALRDSWRIFLHVGLEVVEDLQEALGWICVTQPWVLVQNSFQILLVISNSRFVAVWKRDTHFEQNLNGIRFEISLEVADGEALRLVDEPLQVIVPIDFRDLVTVSFRQTQSSPVLQLHIPDVR